MKALITKSYWLSTLTIAAVISSSLPLSLIVQEKQAIAQSGIAAPNVYIQFGDDAGDSSPELPSQCGNQQGGLGTSTSDGQDPDCLRAQLTDSSNTVYNQDFRFCLQHSNGPLTCTAYASEIGQSEARSGMTPSYNAGNLSGTMYAVVETRPLPSQFPAGTTFGNIQIGVALAYRNNSGPCQSSSGMNWAFQGGGLSGWAYGADRDDDPGCYQAGLRIGSINAPPDADYISTSIPTTLAAGQAHNNDYNIVMENTGMTWPVLGESDSIVRNVDGHCDQANFDYDDEGQITCTDYIIYSSQRFRLQRLDSSPVAVRAKELRPDSNDVTYSNGTYTFTGPDETIVATDPVTTDNTIPFFIKQDVTFRHYAGTTEICVPTEEGDGPPVGGEIILQSDASNKIIKKFLSFLGVKTAQAVHIPEECFPVPYDYLSQEGDPVNPDINAGEQAIFAPVDLTTPSGTGVHTLQFQMVDLDNLNTTNENLDAGKFGEVALIPINLGTAAFSLSCGVNQIYVPGSGVQFLNYDLAATVPGGYTNTINVTMASSPPGPTMQTSPVVLSPSNIPLPYRGTAVIPTAGLLPSTTYMLTFTGSDGSQTATCQSQLQVLNDTVSVDLKFNDSDGPTTPNPSDADNGTLNWTTPFGAGSCTASMLQGSVPSWAGSKPVTGPEVVTGLQPNTTYEFKLLCTSVSGSTTAEDTVLVTVSDTPQNPTADLKCWGDLDDTKAEHDGPCTVTSGASALLFWDSSYAASCSISPDFGPVPTSEPDGQSTSPITADIQYTLTCDAGIKGVPDAIDSVQILMGIEPPSTPINPQVSNTGACGTIDISWNNGSNGNTPEAYRVYRRAASTDPWQQLGPEIPYVVGQKYLYQLTDSSPLSPSGSNYYAVVAVTGGVESSYAIANPSPIVPQACVPNLSLSDKDVVQVSGKINKSFSAVACSGESEIATLPNQAIFSVGDVITFQLNVCNNGPAAMTNVSINDVMTNLSNPSNFSSTASYAKQCLINQSVSGNTIDFTLDDIPADTVPGSGGTEYCSITFTAVVTAPANPSAAIYRFQNVADITATGLSTRVFTPPYLFSVTGGVPNRNETGPQ